VEKVADVACAPISRRIRAGSLAGSSRLRLPAGINGDGDVPVDERGSWFDHDRMTPTVAVRLKLVRNDLLGHRVTRRVERSAQARNDRKSAGTRRNG